MRICKTSWKQKSLLLADGRVRRASHTTLCYLVHAKVVKKHDNSKRVSWPRWLWKKLIKQPTREWCAWCVGTGTAFGNGGATSVGKAATNAPAKSPTPEVKRCLEDRQFCTLGTNSALQLKLCAPFWFWQRWRVFLICFYETPNFCTICTCSVHNRCSNELSRTGNGTLQSQTKH